MKKYIDAEALITSLSVNPLECPGCPEPEFLQELVEILKEAPVADVVEVVRCMECVHRLTPIDPCLPAVCEYGGDWMYDDYCSRGERKGEVEDVCD